MKTASDEPRDSYSTFLYKIRRSDYAFSRESITDHGRYPVHLPDSHRNIKLKRKFLKMEALRLTVGYFPVAFPPLFGIYVLLKPEAIFYGFSPNAPYVIAATLALMAVLFIVCSFGYYLLKKE